MSHTNSAEFRIGFEGGVLSRQIKEERAHGAAAVNFRFDIGEENLPIRQLEFGIQIACVHRTEAQTTCLETALAIDGGGRRANDADQIYVFQFAGNIVSFEKNRTLRIGWQKIRRYQLPALDFHLRNHSQRKRALR